MALRPLKKKIQPEAVELEQIKKEVEKQPLPIQEVEEEQDQDVKELIIQHLEFANIHIEAIYKLMNYI